MLDAQLLLAGIEIAHLAVAGIDRAHRHAHVLRIEVIEIDEVVERGAQRRGLVKGRMVDADARIGIPPRGQVGLKEGRDALPHRDRIGDRARHGGEAEGIALHAVPEFAQLIEPAFGRITGDDGAVDGADGGADHPVRLDAGFVQRLVDAQLIGAQGAAALQHQDNLARQGR